MGITFTADLSKLDALMARIPGALDSFLDKEAEWATAEIMLSFNTSPAGRTYKRGNVTHIASQPGYPPNIDIGTLRASMRWERTGLYSRMIMDGVAYGKMLELGTAKMAARPSVRPVFERLAQSFAAHAAAEGLIT
jgi:hypothetical protein